MAPAIPGYDWNEHPRTFLIVYPSDDCGCGPSPLARAQDAMRQGLDVLVIASETSSQLRTLEKAKLPRERFKLIANADPDTIKRFSDGEVRSLYIFNGRIVRQGQS